MPLTNNNFDLLRLMFASMVCLVHTQALSGYRELEWIPQLLSSALAVKAFFVVSGFLIFMSYERSSSLRSYVVKRVRRIYPAYFIVVMLSACLLWLVSDLSIDSYFSVEWMKYVAVNLVFLNFLHPGLPGVFEGLALPVVNGALWTLKIEVMFYASVPILVWLCCRFGRLRVLVLCYLGSVLYAWLLNDLADAHNSALFRELARQLPGQLSYFVAGAFFYYFLPWFERHVIYFMWVAVPVLLLGRDYPMPVLEPFALATVVAFFGLFFYVGNVGKYGDFSYGIYILHFPIIQVLLHGGWFNGNPYSLLGATIVLPLLAGIAMWHLVEKRFLFRNSHYVAVTHVEAAA